MERPGGGRRRAVVGGVPLRPEERLLQARVDHVRQVGGEPREPERVGLDVEVGGGPERPHRTLRRHLPGSVHAERRVEGRRRSGVVREPLELEPVHVHPHLHGRVRRGVLHVHADALDRELLEPEPGSLRRTGRALRLRSGRCRRRGAQQRDEIDLAARLPPDADLPSFESDEPDPRLAGEHVGLEALHLEPGEAHGGLAAYPRSEGEVRDHDGPVHDPDHAPAGAPLELVGGLEVEGALPDLGRRRVLVVRRVLGQPQPLEGERPVRADGLDAHVAAPAERLARLGRPGQGVRALVVPAVRAEVAEVEREGADAGLERGPPRAVAEVHLRVGDPQVADDERHPLARGPGRGVAVLRPEPRDDVGDVELPAHVEGRVEVRAVEQELGEAQLLLEEATERDAGVEAVERGERRPIPVLHEEALDRDRPRERVHPHALDAHRPLCECAHALQDLVPDDDGGDDESEERVQRHDAHERRQRHAPPALGPPAPGHGTLGHHHRMLPLPSRSGTARPRPSPLPSRASGSACQVRGGFTTATTQGRSAVGLSSRLPKGTTSTLSATGTRSDGTSASATRSSARPFHRAANRPRPA